ncbi:MAG TPA: hypothetical protein DIS78_03540 [Lachnospiraceae bacterium]|nr:hypothetical protein [Lachnospiraceae bacterium]
MKKNILYFIVVLILSSALVSFAGCGSDEAVIELDGERFLQDPPTDIDRGQPECAAIVPDEPMEITEPDGVTVYVCGAVNSPGVYTLDPGLRIVDAVSAACGLREDADECYVNLATLLEDGQRIYIPTREETAESRGELITVGTDGSSDRDGGKVNINLADAAELMTLPGIGEAKASLIIEYRNQNGRFGTIEDIMKISGIKEGMFNRIKDRICI